MEYTKVKGYSCNITSGVLATSEKYYRRSS